MPSLAPDRGALLTSPWDMGWGCRGQDACHHRATHRVDGGNSRREGCTCLPARGLHPPPHQDPEPRALRGRARGGMKPTEPGLWWASCLGDYSCSWGAGSGQGPSPFLPAALPRHPLQGQAMVGPGLYLVPPVQGVPPSSGPPHRSQPSPRLEQVGGPGAPGRRDRVQGPEDWHTGGEQQRFSVDAFAIGPLGSREAGLSGRQRPLADPQALLL